MTMEMTNYAVATVILMISCILYVEYRLDARFYTRDLRFHECCCAVWDTKYASSCRQSEPQPMRYHFTVQFYLNP